MTLQLSTDCRNARLDAIETEAGTGAIVKIRSGAAPANCASADAGTVLISYTLASDWAGAAAGGAKAFSNTPISQTATATGTAAHFRLYKSDGTTCVIQGTVAASGGDLTISDTSVVSGQNYNITGWSMTDGNA